MPKPTRPDPEHIKDASTLRRWYWTKAELVECARIHGLRVSGSKFEILDRIAHYLETGVKSSPLITKPRTTSRFDWHAAPLTPDTEITDSYRNTQNVRRFFKTHAGADFKFNIAFMAWMKDNTGKTLADAVAQYRLSKQQSQQPGHRSHIKPHKQFNQYTRDFLADNPDLGMKDVRRVWALKRALPSETGRHVYDPSDLDLGESDTS